MVRTYGTHGRDEAQSELENLKGKRRWGDLRLEGRIIYKFMIKK
jgi:hypothetical protein